MNNLTHEQPTSLPGIVIKRRDTQGPRDLLDRVDISADCDVRVNTNLDIPFKLPEQRREGAWRADLHPAFCEERGHGYWLVGRWRPGIGYIAEGEIDSFAKSIERAEEMLRSW